MQIAKAAADRDHLEPIPPAWDAINRAFANLPSVFVLVLVGHGRTGKSSTGNSVIRKHLSDEDAQRVTEAFATSGRADPVTFGAWAFPQPLKRKDGDGHVLVLDFEGTNRGDDVATARMMALGAAIATRIVYLCEGHVHNPDLQALGCIAAARYFAQYEWACEQRRDAVSGLTVVCTRLSDEDLDAGGAIGGAAMDIEPLLRDANGDADRQNGARRLVREVFEERQLRGLCNPDDQELQVLAPAGNGQALPPCLEADKSPFARQLCSTLDAVCTFGGLTPFASINAVKQCCEAAMAGINRSTVSALSVESHRRTAMENVRTQTNNACTQLLATESNARLPLASLCAMIKQRAELLSGLRQLPSIMGATAAVESIVTTQQQAAVRRFDEVARKRAEEARLAKLEAEKKAQEARQAQLTRGGTDSNRAILEQMGITTDAGSIEITYNSDGSMNTITIS